MPDIISYDYARKASEEWNEEYLMSKWAELPDYKLKPGRANIKTKKLKPLIKLYIIREVLR